MRIVVDAKRKAMSLMEVLVVIAIMAVLLALLLPAIQRVRAAALRLKSLNNLRQVALATQNYAAANQDYLPSITGMNSAGRGFEFSLHISLLPYLDQGNIYAAYLGKFGPNKAGSDYVIKVFLSPSDPTLPADTAGMSSYAANARVFTPHARLGDISDGTSNTLAYAEHYAFACGGSEFSWFERDALAVPPPSAGGVTVLRRATFADEDMGDVTPVTGGSPPTSLGSVAGLTFQVAPTPAQCDPRLAQTPHPGGLLVALCDGSVRSLAPGMSETTYWGAVTPKGGELPGDDW